VVLPPFGLGASGRTLDALVALSKSRVPFAFGYGSEGSFRLPLAAALARGADRQALERALWSGAAKLIGAETRVGALRAGLDADLVLWSGDPLDLASRPERIYVAGREVYRAAPQLPSLAPKQPRLGVPPTKPHAR
jgi:imidazolonepropionase-like amidohydrolase